MQNEDQVAVVKEIVPHTLHSLFVLRISLCFVAGLLAFLKICLVPPVNSDILDVIADASSRDIFTTWFHTLNVIVSGLLASLLALVIATFFIQARIRSHAEDEAPATLP